MIDYNSAWAQWGDMIKYSPAPFHRRRLILELISQVTFSSALDVGCGNGELLRAIDRAFPGKRLAGADVSDLVVEENRALFPHMEFHCVDLGTGAVDESFDLVVCTEVLEHVAAWRAGLANLRKMCNRELLLTVPSGRIFPIDQMVGHTQHFSAGQLGKALESAGFEVVTTWKWGFPFHSLYKHLINLRPAATLNGFAGGTYSRSQTVLGDLIRRLFYLNTRYWGRQLVISARVVS